MSFGGPIAHLGYFRDEYVVRRRWLDDGRFADLVALAQFLPGPASSQVGIAIGTLRAGPIGGLLAWLGFTLPSAIALVAVRAPRRRRPTSRDAAGSTASSSWRSPSSLVALAAMARSLAPDWRRKAIAIGGRR